MEAGEELESTKTLALRMEHEMLQHRSVNRRLEEEVAALQASLAESKRETELAHSATR